MMALHSALLIVQQEVSCGRHRHNGLCLAVDLATEGDLDITDTLNKLLYNYPLRGDCLGYVVPPVDKWCSRAERIAAYNEANDRGTMWDTSTQYGRNRHALLAWLIEETRP